MSTPDAKQSGPVDGGKPAPVLTPVDVETLSAARRFARIDDAVQAYPHVRRGQAYETLLAQWRQAKTDLVNVARLEPKDQAA